MILKKNCIFFVKLLIMKFFFFKKGVLLFNEVSREYYI